MLLWCIWRLIVRMKGHIVYDLEQNSNPEDHNNDDNDWHGIQSSCWWPVKVPDNNHCHILTIHKQIIDNVSEACMSFDQVEEIKNAHKCSNNIKTEFLYLRGAERCTLHKNPHQHNEPMNATQHKETVLHARRKQSKCQHSWSYYKHTPQEHKYNWTVVKVCLVGKRKPQRLLICSHGPWNRHKRCETGYDLTEAYNINNTSMPL